MNIPNFRSGVDISKIKSLFDSLSEIVKIDDKEYTFSIHLYSVYVHFLSNMLNEVYCNESIYDSSIEHEYNLKFNSNGDLIQADIDDITYFIGG